MQIERSDRPYLDFPVDLMKASRSVPVKEPGCCLLTTFSPCLGVSSENSFARSVPDVKTGAPGGSSWTMCTMGALAARYFSRREEMALRVDSTFSVFRRPLAYLMWLIFRA